MAGIELFCFGPPRLERDGQPIEMGLRKAWALLSYLAVTRQPHSRDALATLLWPESDQPTARASLRRTLYQLGQWIGQTTLEAGPEAIRLAPRAQLWLDVEAFWTLAGPSSGKPAQVEPRRLAEAAAVYTDDFLAGFSLPDC